MNDMKLEIGSKIKVRINNKIRICCICENTSGDIYFSELNQSEPEIRYALTHLVDCTYDVIKVKRYGDLKCEEIKCCYKCPLRALCGSVFGGFTLYENFDDLLRNAHEDNIYDDEIFSIIKKRLDEEVE